MFPKSTIIPNKFIAKEQFYNHADFTAKLKTSMVEDIAKISVINQLSQNTLNVEIGKTFPEIIVLKIILKNKDFNNKLLDIIDTSIRSSFVLFILEFQEEISASIAFKDKIGNNIKTNKRWITPWSNKLDLKIDGRSIDTIYENLIRQISNGELIIDNNKSLKEKIIVSINKEKIEKKIKQLETKMNKEIQLKKKLTIKYEIDKIRKENN